MESLGAGTRSNRSVCVEVTKERESMAGFRINWAMKATEGVPLCGAQWVLPALVRTRGFWFLESRIFNMIAKTEMTKQSGTWCSTIPGREFRTARIFFTLVLFFTPAYSDLLQSLRLVSQGSTSLAVTHNYIVKDPGVMDPSPVYLRQ